MIVQLNNDSSSSTTTVTLPSGVAFLIANTAAFAAIIGSSIMVMSFFVR